MVNIRHNTDITAFRPWGYSVNICCCVSILLIRGTAGWSATRWPVLTRLRGHLALKSTANTQATNHRTSCLVCFSRCVLRSGCRRPARLPRSPACPPGWRAAAGERSPTDAGRWQTPCTAGSRSESTSGNKFQMESRVRTRVLLIKGLYIYIIYIYRPIYIYKKPSAEGKDRSTLTASRFIDASAK